MSSQRGHVHVTLPLDAGAFAMSFRTDAGSGASSTRHGPSCHTPGSTSGGIAMHSVTPNTWISVPAPRGAFQVTVILFFVPDGVIVKVAPDGGPGTASGVGVGVGWGVGRGVGGAGVARRADGVAATANGEGLALAVIVAGGEP